MKTILKNLGLIVGGCGFLYGATYLPHFRLNFTESMPRGLYRETHEPITRGALVMDCLPPTLAEFGKQRGYLQGGDCPGHTISILKKVVGIGGDEIEVEEEFIAVNNEIIFNSETREFDSRGRTIPCVARGTFTLQEDEVFLLTTYSERSWDGRYTGPTKRADILATVRPVWTEREE